MQRPTSQQYQLVWLFLGCWLAASPPSLQAQVPSAPARTLVRESSQPLLDPEQLYLQELRAQGLERLAEEYCRMRLQQATSLRSERRALYTIVLSDIIARRAREAPSASEREALWDEASSLLQALLEADTAGPETPSVRYQLAQLQLAAAQYERLRWAIAPDDAARRAGAREYLSRARSLAEQARRDVDRQLQRLSATESAARSATYRAIDEAAQLLAARCHLEQALLEESGSPGRIRAARAAIELLEPLVEHLHRRRDEPFVRPRLAETRIALAEAYLLANEFRQARRVIQELEQSKPPTEYLDRALLLRTRILAAQHRWQAVYSFVRDARGLLQRPAPALELLYLEACLRLAIRRGKLEAAEFVEEALRTADQLQKQHGAYWRARADVIVAGLLPSARSITDPQIALKLAQVAANRREEDTAIELYQRALELSAPAASTHRQAQLGLAALLRRAGRLAEAAERFEAIAAEAPGSAEAAHGLLQAAYCYAQLYRRQRSADVLARYERCLDQLVRVHKHREAGQEGIRLLARLRASQQRWEEAARLYRELVELDDRHPIDAIYQAARCYGQALRQRWAAEEPADRLLSEASGFLRARIRVLRSAHQQQALRAVVAELAAIYTNDAAGRFAEAVELLEDVFGGENLRQGELDQVRATYLVALIGARRLSAAQHLAQQVRVRDVELAIELLERLARIGAHATHPQLRHAIGTVQLRLLERLPEQAERDRSYRLRIAVARGMALMQLGKIAEAQAAFRMVQDALQSDRRALLAYARSLSALRQYAAAREAWRRLSRMYRPPDPIYYEAKYELAYACLKLGDAAQCRKIIETLEVLHPSLGGPAWRDRFRRLKAEAILRQ